MLELDLQLASEAQGLPSETDFRRWCELALRQRSADSELTIRLVDEPEGRELNRTWRHKDYATNVLSFPADVPDELLDIPLLGDLAICAPVVARKPPNRARPWRRTGRTWRSTAVCTCSATTTSRTRKPRKWKPWNGNCWLNLATPTLTETTKTNKKHRAKDI